MRRASRLLVATAATAMLAAPPAALAKGEAMGVRIQSDATHLRAGQAWDLTFTVLAAPDARRLRQPAVWIEDAGLIPATYFTARPTGVAGQYRARVTFPAPGAWTYTVGERQGRFFDFRVKVAAAAKKKSSALLGATPLAALALCAALGGATLVRRRRHAG
jgi:hypothetical protein